MSLNNQYTHSKPAFSLASMCLDRMKIERPLKTGYGYCAKLMSDVEFKNKDGLKVTRQSIADHYGASCRLVLNVFTRNNNDYKLAHKELEARL